MKKQKLTRTMSGARWKDSKMINCHNSMLLRISNALEVQYTGLP